MKINLKTILAILSCVMFMPLLFTSCEYDVIEPEKVELPPADQKISFSETIEPIFTSKCATCHASRNPVMTQGKVYNSLMNGYIDLTTPAESIVYKKIETGHPSAGTVSETEKALILRWITEGAMNN